MNSEIYITSTLATEKVPERFSKAYLTGKSWLKNFLNTFQITVIDRPET